MKKTINPIVSVVIPCYNSAQFLEKTIDSIIKQTLSDWELILVDDGSTDETKKIIENWMKKDERIKRVFHDRNYGVAKASNTGLKNTRGKYVLVMGSDDLLESDALETCVEILEKEKANAITFDVELIDENDRSLNIKLSEFFDDKLPQTVKSIDLFEELIIGKFLQTALIKKDIIETYKITFEENLKHLNDFLFFLDVAAVTRFFYVPRPLYKYRRHSKNLSSDTKGYFKDYEVFRRLMKNRYPQKIKEALIKKRDLIEKARAFESELCKDLKDRSFLLAGMGFGGELFFRNFCQKYNLLPALVMDKNKKRLEEVCRSYALSGKILSLKEIEELPSNLFVVVTVRKKAIQEEIESMFSGKSFYDVVSIPEFYWNFLMLQELVGDLLKEVY